MKYKCYKCGEDIRPDAENYLVHDNKFSHLSCENKSQEIFTKHDSNKPPLSILFDTASALGDVANVMQYGADKYSRENWKKVDNKERYISAPMRHMAAYRRGEKIDKESGYPHLAHAICSLLFLAEIDSMESEDE